MAAHSLSMLLCFFFVLSCLYQCTSVGAQANQSAQLTVDASSEELGHKASETLFGIFFEEINHAGAGGLWAELVSNRGFESGIPSIIDPWTVIGDESSILVSTDQSSCFARNKIAVRTDILCDTTGSNVCPAGGVGICNPGYWGMNIEQGKTYKLVLHVKSLDSVNISVSLASGDGSQMLASTNIIATASNVLNWTKFEILLKAKETDHSSKLQLTTMRKGVIWFDQISLMPVDTYNGHGFRKNLFDMLVSLKPRFIRFPGGCFVEGEWLRNAFRWKETVGPWEERPGHLGDVWNYWTDDGIGYYELLQLAEDLGALPVWVVNIGISHKDEVNTSNIRPFLQDMLDSIEFARGAPNKTWGSMRAAMGHPEPFDLRYLAMGNEDCGKKNYRGNYLEFYNALKKDYPDIKVITNCDGSTRHLDHPADIYDYHIYTSAEDLFSMSRQFDHALRNGPKAFVSEYAVKGKDAGNGSFLAGLAEAGFLIGLEKNSDVVEMASYAPLFVNVNDWRWNPDAIVFDSWQQYGTPSYWVQQFFTESSGATVLNTNLQPNSSTSLVASAIIWENPEDNNKYLKIKVVNFGSNLVNLKISIDGLGPKFIGSPASTTVLTSSNTMAENSFAEPKKVAPVQNILQNPGSVMDVVLSPHSFTSFEARYGDL